MENVDFFALPRDLQDRIVGGIEGRFPPVPSASVRTRVKPPLLWLAVCGGSLLALLVFHRLGYGSLGSSLAHHGAAFLPLYMVLAFGFFLGVAKSLGTYTRAARLPYPLGIYVYGARVIDAQSHPMRTFPLADAEHIAVEGGNLVIRFPGGQRFSIPVEAERAGTLVEELEHDRTRVTNLANAQDSQALIILDPLHQPKFSNPVGESEPLRFELPAWVRLTWVIAGVLGLALGGTVFAVRNLGSDAKLFAHATEEGTPEAFRQYLAGGSRHATEVRKILLPRAELALARKDGSVETILAFEKSHPDTGIGSEIQAAKRKAYLAELERAKEKKTLPALVDFATKYPGHGLDAEYKGAIHDLFVDAQSKYAGATGGRSKDAAQFLARIIGNAESHGPAVEIRFRRREGATMSRVDKTMAKLPEYMGEISRPSRYFDEAHSAARDKVLGEAIVDAFGKAFPKEILAMKVGDPIADPGKSPLPAVTVPTLFITHFEDWSGHSYSSKKPRGVFIGVFFNFDAEFVIPGDTAVYKQKFVIFRGLPMALLKELETAPRTAPPIEERLYETMADEAKKQFEAKFVKTLVGDGGQR
ncbi:MAG: hypothetical protein HOO96_07610 [Polyangiaceae bacterium]|nr:hypothetical protein [Polyangiaceae bacterium]